MLPRFLVPDENQNNNDENTFKTLVLNKYKHYKRDYNTKDTKLSKFFAYKTRKSHKTRQQQLSRIFPKKTVKPVIFLTTRKACVYNSRVLNNKNISNHSSDHFQPRCFMLNINIKTSILS